MKLLITKVKEDKKYAGSYAKIFRILNGDSIFCEVYYESDESKGFENGNYTLEINEDIEPHKLDLILAIKNVTLITNT
jgi:hypothetical protein